MKIEIDSRPAAEMRYATLGDWLPAAGSDLGIQVVELPDWRHMLLIAVHELIEAALCKQREIPEPAVMRFDLENPLLDDPGSDPRAPYHREHMFAMAIERALATELGVDWADYEKACEAACASL